MEYMLNGSKSVLSVPLHVPKTYLKHNKLIRSDIAICNILVDCAFTWPPSSFNDVITSGLLWDGIVNVALKLTM